MVSEKEKRLLEHMMELQKNLLDYVERSGLDDKSSLSSYIDLKDNSISTNFCEKYESGEPKRIVTMWWDGDKANIYDFAYEDEVKDEGV